MSESQKQLIFEEWESVIERQMEEYDQSLEMQEFRFLIGEKLMDFLDDLKGELDV